MDEKKLPAEETAGRGSSREWNRLELISGISGEDKIIYYLKEDMTRNDFIRLAAKITDLLEEFSLEREQQSFP